MKMEDYSKYYIQGSDHYLIPKDVFIELFNEMVNWKEESKISYRKCLNILDKKEVQQKEFIDYLEDEIKRLKENDIYQPLQKMALATHEHILQKYKSIIGGASNE